MTFSAYWDTDISLQWIYHWYGIVAHPHLIVMFLGHDCMMTFRELLLVAHALP